MILKDLMKEGELHTDLARRPDVGRTCVRNSTHHSAPTDRHRFWTTDDLTKNETRSRHHFMISRSVVKVIRGADESAVHPVNVGLGRIDAAVQIPARLDQGFWEPNAYRVPRNSAVSLDLCVHRCETTVSRRRVQVYMHAYCRSVTVGRRQVIRTASLVVTLYRGFPSFTSLLVRLGLTPARPA